VSVPLPRSNEADVAANREARITGRQLLDLWYSGLWRLLIGLPIAGIGVAMSWGPPLPSIPVANFIVMAMGIGALGYGTYLSWRGFSFIGDAITRRVTYVTGQVGREEKIGFRGAKYYYMVVGPVKTLLYRRSTYEALPVGVDCHAYYVPGSGHLLSLEPATADEPHPALRFGGDAAHAWDRLRWSWLLVAVAIYGLGAGVYGTISAHSAHWGMISGRISEYHEVQVRSTTRYFHIESSSQQYALNSLDHASPPAPQLYDYVGDPVDLYVNADDASDVLAMRLRGTLYTSDLYIHPEHQFWGMLWSGAPIALVSAAFLALLVSGIIHLRKHPAQEMTDVEKRAHQAMHM
jgi:hypothetical protein